jgi:hypothetical protein
MRFHPAGFHWPTDKENPASQRLRKTGVQLGKSREWKLPIDKPSIEAVFPKCCKFSANQSRVPHLGSEKPVLVPEPKSPLQVLTPASSSKAGDSFMRSKLAISALVVASLLGATAIASAQTQPAPGASSEGNVGPGATGSKMKSGKMKSSKMKSGTTTGMSAGAHKGDARNPSGQGNVGPGTDSNAGRK